MKPCRFLPYLHHQARSIFALLSLLVLYCLWLWLLGFLGLIERNSSAPYVASLLLLPLLPVGLFDLCLRLSWQADPPRLLPPPPGRLEKLFGVEYGLYWFPVLIRLPWWLWAFGLNAWALFHWLR